ncbi:hypothetical protein TRAPUB_3204 [Trametes pubescens]|uniref:Uncharacterized protein n=1 Tax=Trametes pubescens TaxID=154538 RepID=A0A1M2VEP8_TRAPU|nr:hypothetical protein TRAPUB_3204 [Trametes pubescens]
MVQSACFEQANVSTIHRAGGQEVRTEVNLERQDAGNRALTWDSASINGTAQQHEQLRIA